MFGKKGNCLLAITAVLISLHTTDCSPHCKSTVMNIFMEYCSTSPRTRRNAGNPSSVESNRDDVVSNLEELGKKPSLRNSRAATPEILRILRILPQTSGGDVTLGLELTQTEMYEIYGELSERISRHMDLEGSLNAFLQIAAKCCRDVDNCRKNPQMIGKCP